ncbi:hypothetical protein AAZX31_05G148700 [Glycine max]|uniref:Receptor-like protein 51 n=3 Tax=Glycine subgen. Soja TaxID=1462606 RepID=A0A445KP76_GLYSO|nr:receptor-like protein 51 [Glycine soja]KAG5040997.1 hypothetical protein JHK85_013473 [Glycine max]KAG5029514.1 hypothetical protein JHK87_013028 [Glycine soja]KAG5058136.1 hypothetical protein JHK86_013132 [Glycine max]KAG5155134.1 hypothetical protein JHK82_013103 [Glycine max]KAH1250829.1 Receptor-like protein 51 [Glycine max]
MIPSPLPQSLITILLFLLPTTTLSVVLSLPLDPKQVKALQSLNIPSPKDPCSQPTSFLCDTSTPFRHLTSLQLTNCSTSIHHSLSSTALKSLSTLLTLHLLNCPITPSSPTHFPPQLLSLTSINSLPHLSAASLSRLKNLTHLTLSYLTIKPYLILSHFTALQTLIISHANLTCSLPKHLHSPNLTYLDLSFNNLKGNIPPSITMLENLQVLNLSSNGLKGEIPSSIGDLISLKNLSLAFNSFSGDVPDSLSAIPGLLHLDLSSNQLNGTIPTFISEMRNLKHLNLANNLLHGVVPFNSSFIDKLEVLKVGGNGNLCYNRSVLSSKFIMKLEIAPCDKFGRPVSPPPSKRSNSADDGSDGDYDYDDGDGGGGGGSVRHMKEHHHGPNKVVLGVAIALSSIVFLVVFLILCSKCCR